MNRVRFFLLFVLFLLAVLGSFLVYYSTSWGIGTSLDSKAYIVTARNLVNNLGYTKLTFSGPPKPETAWPPVYPGLLAILGKGGIDPLSGARGLHIVLFGFNIFLAGLLTRRVTSSSWASVLAAFLILSSLDMLKIHTMAWSEPSFIVFTFLGLFFLASYLQNNKGKDFVLSAICVAVSSMTRYAGLVLVFTSIIGLWLFSKKVKLKRFMDMVLFSMISCLPIGLWLFRNYQAAGDWGGKGRSIVFHLPEWEKFNGAMDTISQWIFPGSIDLTVRTWLMMVVIILCCLILARIKKHRFSDENHEKCDTLAPLLLLFMGSFFIFLTLVILWVDVSVSFNARILAPVFYAAVIFAVSIIAKLIMTNSKLAVRATLGALLLCLCVSYSLQAAQWINKRHKFGQGFASKYWHQSPLMNEIRSLEQDQLIYTNEPAGVYLLTGRVTRNFPIKYSFKSGLPSDKYISKVQKMGEDLNSQNGYLVYFENLGWRRNRPDIEELKKWLPLKQIFELEDGSIYQLPSD